MRSETVQMSRTSHAMAQSESYAGDLESQKLQQNVEKTVQAKKKKKSFLKDTIPKWIGNFLRWMLYLTWLVQFHVSFLAASCFALLSTCFQDHSVYTRCSRTIQYLIMSISAILTPPAVVYVLNRDDMFDFYDEWQSWQIAYCIWGFTCGSTFLIAFVIDEWEDKDSRFIHELEAWLFWLFGLKLDHSFQTAAIYWMFPLVSMAVAIIAGFIVNFAIEERYRLTCRESYSGDAVLSYGICYEYNGDVFCCRPRSSHNPEDLAVFLRDLAATILSAWGVVKSTGYFICKHDDTLAVVNEETGKKVGNSDGYEMPQYDVQHAEARRKAGFIKIFFTKAFTKFFDINHYEASKDPPIEDLSASRKRAIRSEFKEFMRTPEFMEELNNLQK